MPGISAVILAAGESSRMGSSKPLLTIEGRPLLAHTLEVARRSAVTDTVVVLGHDADLVRNTVPMRDVTIVVNRAYREGMSTSLRAGVRACNPTREACLVLLVDQPFLRAKTIDAMIEAYRIAPAAILVPTFRGRRGNPVLLRRAVWPEVETLTGDLGFRAVFGKHSKDLREVPVGDPGVLIDIDTQQDLERIRRALETKQPIESLV